MAKKSETERKSDSKKKSGGKKKSDSKKKNDGKKSDDTGDGERLRSLNRSDKILTDGCPND